MHYTLAFIVPVALIFLVDSAFLLMAAVIMWQHGKKRKGQHKSRNLRKWLQSLFSLIVIMGLNWVVGVLVVEIEQLLPLAYIFTIMAAFQGVWIFVIFVLLPGQVRKEYRKLWRSKVKTKSTLSKYWLDSKATTRTVIVRVLRL